MRKYLSFMAASLATLCGCTASLSESFPAADTHELTISASYGDPETRTERAGDGAVLWSPGDRISLFYGSGTDGGSCFTAQNTEAAKVVNFTGTIGVITGGNDISVEETYFWATYPYCPESSCDGTSVTTVLPSAQMAAADTFADDLFPSIGRSQGLNMSFYNICGGLKFTVSEEGIKSVTLKGNNGEILAGHVTVGFTESGLPEVLSVADGAETITVSAPEGESLAPGKAYYIVLVPTVFESGFTLTFSKGYAEGVYERSKATTIRRSVFGSLSNPDNGIEWQMLYVPIPDAEFKTYMIANFDTDGNGELDFDEALSVKEINVITNNIESLSGIEYFENLEILSCRGSVFGAGNLLNIDVSKNIRLRTLLCDCNKLTSLDLSSNSQLKSLSCNGNQLSSLELSHNPQLYYLDCGQNKLEALDLSANTHLDAVSCEINQIGNLDLSKNTSLTYLSCGACPLVSLDISGCSYLESLDCAHVQLTDLDISVCSQLESLDCSHGLLTGLDVSGNVQLTCLSCSYNKLSSLDVSNNTKLEHLDCCSNSIGTLDISNNTQLTELWCEFNELTSLDVSNNGLLTDLRCSDNKITVLTLGNNEVINSISCIRNKLTNIDVSACPRLCYLWCSGNQLVCLDVSKNKSLRNLWCSPMSTLEVLYISEGQVIHNVTQDRSVDCIPEGTLIMIPPESGGSEGTGEENLD